MKLRELFIESDRRLGIPPEETQRKLKEMENVFGPARLEHQVKLNEGKTIEDAIKSILAVSIMLEKKKRENPTRFMAEIKDSKRVIHKKIKEQNELN
jgi:hypothetical protein